MEFCFFLKKYPFFTQGWKWHSPACYWVGEDLVTFDEAKKTCEGYGAALVTITNRCIATHTHAGSVVAAKNVRKPCFPMVPSLPPQGSSRLLPTAWCSGALTTSSGLALLTRGAPGPSTGSVGTKCHSPTGIETSQVSCTRGSVSE